MSVPEPYWCQISVPNPNDIAFELSVEKPGSHIEFQSLVFRFVEVPLWLSGLKFQLTWLLRYNGTYHNTVLGSIGHIQGQLIDSEWIRRRKNRNLCALYRYNVYEWKCAGGGGSQVFVFIYAPLQRALAVLHLLSARCFSFWTLC